MGMALLLFSSLVVEVVAPEIAEEDVGEMVQYIIDSSVSAPAAGCSSAADADEELCRFLCTARAPWPCPVRLNTCGYVVGLLRSMMNEVNGHEPGRTTAEFVAMGLECDSTDAATPASEPVDTAPMTQYIVDAAIAATPPNCSEAPEGEDLCA